MSSTPRKIVIDDTDEHIQYAGQGWFQDNGSQDGLGNFGPTYQHTLHGTNMNDSFSFNFNGTSINVIGTTNLAKTANNWDPTWECFVDKISIGSTDPFQFAENNWSLCRKDGLIDGLHELTVNVTTAGRTFWFDSIQYTPSSHTSLETAVVLVENNDLGISYGSGWQALGGTANMTGSKGATALFNFIGNETLQTANFIINQTPGKGLSWVGFIPTELPHNATSATYSIDGGHPVAFLLQGLSPGSTPTAYNQIFFTTPELLAGPHSILVTFQGTGQSTPLTLDFIYLTNSSLPSNTIPNPSTNPNPTNLNPSTNSTTSSQLSGGKDGPPVGAIVGGIIGGLGLISLTLLLWWIKRRQNLRHSLQASGNVTPIPPHHEVTPFFGGSVSQRPGLPVLSHSTSYHQSSVSSTELVSPDASLYVTPFLSPQGILDRPGDRPSLSGSGHAPSASMSSGLLSGYNINTVNESRAMRKAQEGSRQPPRQPIVHEDSGLRLHGGDAIIEDVPPSYTAS